MREQINKSFEGMRNMEDVSPIPTTLEELRRQNMEMFEKTMKMMSPFGVGYGQSSEDDKSKKGK